MNDQLLARLAALKTTPTPSLKEQWRQLFETAPPPFNRRYLESRLAYRIQELTLGGLKPETVRRLEKLGEELDGGRADVRKRPASDWPVCGTRLIGSIRVPRIASRCARMISSTRAGPTSRSRPSPAPSPARSGMAPCSSD